MRSTIVPLLLALGVVLAGNGRAQAPATRLNPAVKRIVDAVSEERIAATMKKLESFGTRYILSDQDHPTHGIGAAQRWIVEEFKSYSPRLEVTLQSFTVKKGYRVARDVELANVVAVLPGTINKDRQVLISAHYDSLAFKRRPGWPGGEGDGTVPPPADVLPDAPGVVDDGSGTAAVLELARVMSQHEFDKTIVFVAFSAEEVGLQGSRAYATRAKEQKTAIEAVLNNDIIGSDVSGNGRSINSHVRVFADGPEDSPARAVARYTKEMAERYVPSMTVDLILRRDRFGRGGDHTSFTREGFAAVRLSTASEHFANQHTATDTFANASPSYTTRVAKINAAVLASLALAPKPPVVTREITTGPRRGIRPLLTRGKSGYDAVLQWKQPDPEPDLAGYAVVIRSTTSALWEREIYVGNVAEYTMPDFSIDDVVIGVKAIDKDGNQSLVSAYEVGLPRFAEPASAAPTPATATTAAQNR